MTKKEIQNIVNKDWDKRRIKSKKKSKINSQYTKEWKLKEKSGNRSSSNPTPVYTTLSLLVAVTYAKDY